MNTLLWHAFSKALQAKSSTGTITSSKFVREDFDVVLDTHICNFSHDYGVAIAQALCWSADLSIFRDLVLWILWQNKAALLSFRHNDLAQSSQFIWIGDRMYDFYSSMMEQVGSAIVHLDEWMEIIAQQLLRAQISINTKPEPDIRTTSKVVLTIPQKAPRNKHVYNKKIEEVDVDDVIGRLSTLGLSIIEHSVVKMIYELSDREKAALQAHIGKMEKYAGPIRKNHYVEDLQGTDFWIIKFSYTGKTHRLIYNKNSLEIVDIPDHDRYLKQYANKWRN